MVLRCLARRRPLQVLRGPFLGPSVVQRSLPGEPGFIVVVSADTDVAFSLEAEKPVVKKEMSRTVRASPMEAAFDEDPMLVIYSCPVLVF